jgi:hypothetical protein
MHGSRRFCASASFSALLVVACRSESPPPAREAPDAAALAATALTSAERTTAAPEATDVPRSGDAALAAVDPYLAAAPVSARSVGHTSYVLKVRLDNGLVVAFKARSKLPLGDRRYRGEIAAYRMARALGLGNVPVAMPRAFVAAELRRAFPTPEGAQDFDRRALVDGDGTIHGALIPWIAQYRELPIEAGEARARWEHWLTDAAPEIGDGDRATARAISTLLAFDYVTANWDRWSGGNVAQDGATGTLLYVDNDGAFYESPPQDALARQLALLRRVRRFSRSFVAALRALDASAIRDFLGSDLEGDLLPARVVADADARRQTVLATIDQQIQRAGESATLVFE